MAVPSAPGAVHVERSGQPLGLGALHRVAVCRLSHRPRERLGLGERPDLAQRGGD
jgi:hypothetical protein